MRVRCDTAVPVNPPGTAQLHRKTVFTMLFCCVLWSLSGIVSRQFEQAAGFEAAFWRSLFAALAVAAWLIIRHGRAAPRQLAATGAAGLFSGLMWSVMLTAFMIALLMTTVAKAMIVLAVAPLLTALLSRAFLGERVAARTWFAIALAGIGMVWMVSDALAGDEHYPYSAWGMLIASAVPLASACNLIVMKRSQARVDLMPALLIGASISALATLPFALPFVATTRDMAWLAFLGVFQLALPGLLFITAAKSLSAAESALLILLEVVFAPLWVWIGAGERPADATLWGGSLVLSALMGNEWLATRSRPRAPTAQAHR
ncbi:MAG: DMT family transporter [Burkholderiaceae bacterium]